MRTVTPFVATILCLACSSANTASDATVDAGIADQRISDAAADGGGDAGEPRCLVTFGEGAVQGRAQQASCAFKGIPYAKPPVGPLRWEPPQKPDPWSDVRDATEYGFACPQAPCLAGDKWGRGSEDCLTLNVWTKDPQPAEPAPVLVWIHKGDLFLEGSALKWADGTDMVERTGVVVVSFNYRLGALGFLAHPKLGEGSGNYGLLDQVAALAWVEENIAAFGGDPGNVTIMGGGQGTMSVCAHLVSKKSEGLFHKAIMQGGSCLFAVPTDPVFSMALASDRAEAQGELLAQRLGCAAAADPIACLREKDEKKVRNALVTRGPLRPGEADWGPVVDGEVLSGMPEALVRSGAFHRVPLLIGTNKNDGYGFASGFKFFTEDVFHEGLKGAFGANAEAVIAQYPVSAYTPPAGSNMSATAWAAGDLYTDLLWTCPSRRVARAFAGAAVDTYLYHFTLPITYGSMGNDPYMGTGNQTIKVLVFHTPLQEPETCWYAWRFNADEEALSWKIMDYWTRFARTGDPNGEGAVAWPKYDVAADEHLELGKEVVVKSTLEQTHCDFWDGLVPP